MMTRLKNKLTSGISFLRDIFKYGFYFTQLHQSLKHCKGFTSKCLLFHLYSKVLELEKIDGDIVEIGSAWGRSTIIIAKALQKTNQKIKFFAIDPHTGGLDYLKKLGVEKIDSFEEFLTNLKKSKVENLVTPIRKTSDDAVGDIDSEKLKLLWIDGWHTPDAIEKDLNNYFGKLVVGGYLILDDYDAPKYREMKRKIDEMLQTLPVDPNIKIIENALFTKRTG